MADSKVSALTETTTLADADEVYVVDGGVSKRTTIATLKALLTVNANLLINGMATWINQRAVTGSVVLSAGEYGHDRWKGGSAGCSYTFATSAGITTLTISAGTLVQVVEGLSLSSGTHILSWTGTATAQIDSGGYGATGVTGTLTGGTNATIEVSTGTLANVKLEAGTVGTTVTPRPIAEENSMCKRYYNAGSVDVASAGAFTNNNISCCLVSFSTEMRTTPTMVLSNPVNGGQTGTLGALSNDHATVSGFSPQYATVGATLGASGFMSYDWTADAEI